METNGSVSAKNDPVKLGGNSETKAKIAQCFLLSMEIGYNFNHAPVHQMCEAFNIENGEYTSRKTAWYHQGSIDTLDNLIDWLNERIAENA